MWSDDPLYCFYYSVAVQLEYHTVQQYVKVVSVHQQPFGQCAASSGERVFVGPLLWVVRYSGSRWDPLRCGPPEISPPLHCWCSVLSFQKSLTISFVFSFSLLHNCPCTRLTLSGSLPCSAGFSKIGSFYLRSWTSHTVCKWWAAFELFWKNVLEYIIWLSLYYWCVRSTEYEWEGIKIL